MKGGRWTRRQFVGGLVVSGMMAAYSRLLPAYSRLDAAAEAVAGEVPHRGRGPVELDVAIREEIIDIAGGRATATTINNTVPGPLVELWEGEDAILRVTNHLDEDSSIHWHGILLPFEMDGVPGVTFPGIPPGETFEARFPVRQYGTYWYHSHSGLQEQTGVYGPLVVHPREPEPFGYERDYVVVLSDWTFEDPHAVLAKLKKQSDYYNFNQRTVGDFLRRASESGLVRTVQDRLAWGNMRMSPRDLADVTAHTYTYLMNGLHAEANWTGLFRRGERVRLRIINASAMTFFNLRIPGLPMTVVLADGQYVEPVETDEFQIGVAERYDVIVEPASDRAYTIMAESMDRSGYVRGTLAPSPGMEAPVPPIRERAERTMVDMGMDMEGMDMEGMDMGEALPIPDGSAHAAHGDAGGMDMADVTPSSAPTAFGGNGHGGHGDMDRMAGATGPVVARHGPDWHGPGNISVAEVQRDRLAERGTGLKDVPHRVLTYAQLRNVLPMQDKREPSHTVELHLTGHMENYMWSFDGIEFHAVDGPIDFPYGERVRLIMVNDTMMEHPIHLHGMFMELENGQGDRLPFKDTIYLKPAERLSLLITANEPGRWAFHCHLLYHMEMGMFRVVRVRDGSGSI